MEWLTFIVLVFAVHRATVLVIEDQITKPLRDRLFARWNPSDTWTYLFTCPWCVSIWLAGIAITSYLLFPTFTFYGAAVLALSSLTGLIEEKR